MIEIEQLVKKQGGDCTIASLFFLPLYLPSTKIYHLEKITRYRKIIQQVLRPFGEGTYAGSSDVTTELIFDKENDHYLVVNFGWEGEKPVRDCIFHIDIAKDGKVWIQEDNSDADIASLLIEAGIPESDIVLGFHSPSMRRFLSHAMS